MIGELVERLVGLTDDELDQFIRTKELERRTVDAQLATAIAAAEARVLNQADGHRSMKAYLKATLDWSDGECARFRGAAQTIDEHPEIGDAWLNGRLGSAQVSELSKARSHRAAGERFGEFVPTFVQQGEELPLADFKVVLQRFVHLADADGTFDERQAIERRTATATAVGGELFLKASGGDALASAELVEILRRFEDAEFRKDIARHDAAVDAGEIPDPFRSGPQRRFDALIAMARAADAHDGDVTGSSPLVSVLVDQRTMSWVIAHSGLGAASNLAGEAIDPFTGLPMAAGALDDLLGDAEGFLDRRCETTTGVPLRATDVLRAVLSGEIRRVVLGAARRVVDMGRSRRVFTGAARDAARLLTVTCEHPGCDMPAAWCQVDHSTEWHEHGGTDQDNAATLCRYHNAEKHRRRRRTRRAPNGRLFTFRPDGTIMLQVGCRPPRFDEPDDDADLDDSDDEPEFSPEDERRLAETIRHRVAMLTPA